MDYLRRCKPYGASNFFYDNPVASNYWPSIPNAKAARTLSLLKYMEYSQWLSAEEILQYQFTQLQTLIDYSKKHSFFYRDYPLISSNADLSQLLSQWAQLPILTREQLQKNFDDICSNSLPAEYGQPQRMSSSGSTGKPVSVLTDIVGQFFWNAITLRDYSWHGIKLEDSLASIRDVEAPFPGTHCENWGSATKGIFKTGPLFLLGICDPKLQLEWLKKINPHYLICYPTILRELLSLDLDGLNNLTHLITFGELIDESLCQRVNERFDVPMHDMYSSTEVGYIALQCPEYGNYHVQEENVFVEVLNHNNQPCLPGEVGRIVITSLHNLASPLIRYELGDYAEVGDKCPCKRGLRVLRRILGRQRNMLTLPTGEKRWPTFTGARAENLITLLQSSQFQVIQKSLYDIEIKIVHSGHPLPENKMVPIIQSLFGYPFNIKFNYVTHIPRSARGKYEDFKSELIDCKGN